MIRAATVVVIVFLSSSICLARIGESRKDCLKRYGDPVRTQELKDVKILEFEVESVHIYVEIDPNTDCCDYISYSIPKGYPPLFPHTPARREALKQLLDNNAAGHEWKRDRDSRFAIYTNDRGLSAAVTDYEVQVRAKSYDDRARAEATKPTSGYEARRESLLKRL